MASSPSLPLWSSQHNILYYSRLCGGGGVRGGGGGGGAEKNSVGKFEIQSMVQYQFQIQMFQDTLFIIIIIIQESHYVL